jgi:hypothetical protein
MLAVQPVDNVALAVLLLLQCELQRCFHHIMRSRLMVLSNARTNRSTLSCSCSLQPAAGAQAACFCCAHRAAAEQELC